MLGSNPVDIKHQSACITSRKTSIASLVGVDFQKTSALKNSVSSANEHALLCTNPIEQSRPYASAHFVFAEVGHLGRRP